MIYIWLPSAEESTVRSLPDSSGETQSRLYHRERVVAVIVQSDTDKLVRKKEKSKHKPYFYVAVVYRPWLLRLISKTKCRRYYVVGLPVHYWASEWLTDCVSDAIWVQLYISIYRFHDSLKTPPHTTTNGTSLSGSVIVSEPRAICSSIAVCLRVKRMHLDRSPQSTQRTILNIISEVHEMRGQNYVSLFF